MAVVGNQMHGEPGPRRMWKLHVFTKVALPPRRVDAFAYMTRKRSGDPFLVVRGEFMEWRLQAVKIVWTVVIMGMLGTLNDGL